MNVDSILRTAISAVKSAMPEAIYQGSLVKKTRAFNPSDSTTIEMDSVIKPAEIIFDTLTSEEIVGTTIKQSSIKMHIVADQIADIDFYQYVRVNSKDYKIARLIQSIVGSKTAVFTIIGEL